MNNDTVLKNFLEEQFCFDSLKEAGLFKGLKRTDYKEQAERVCNFFGYESVYEYGSKGFRCHITFADPDDPTGLSTSRPIHVDENGKLKTEPLITEIKGIYE